MQNDFRYLLISLFVTAGFTFLAIAYPKMSRSITVTGACLSFLITIFLAWPEFYTFFAKIDTRYRLTTFIFGGMLLGALGGWGLCLIFPGQNHLKIIHISQANSSEAVAHLSELGWTVKPKAEGIQFEISSGPLPSMEESAKYFKQINKPFNLHFQQVNNLEGLHYLAKISGCKKVEINAGEFTDISELSEFTQLTDLVISQLPLSGTGQVDLAPLSSLSNLQHLVLSDVKAKSINALAELKNLRDLNIGNTLVADLTPISTLLSLESLEIRNAPITDLRPLAQLKKLRELLISENQVADLTNLSHLQYFKKLTILGQGFVDLSAISGLKQLETLNIWLHGPIIDLAPLHNLTSLHTLSVSGLAYSGLTNVTNIQSISNLREVQEISLASLKVHNLSFIEHLTEIKNLSLSNLPISDITPLQKLTSLTKLLLFDTSIHEISPLLTLPKLTQLKLMRTPVRSDQLSELKKHGVEVESF